MRYVFTACFALIILLTAFRHSQEFRITGVVRDEKGLPLSGVTVMEKQNHSGKHQGTTTGSDGSFSLMVSTKNPVLIFLLTGYEKKEFKVGENEKPVQITMVNTQQSLQETVVTAYSRSKGKKRMQLPNHNMIFIKLPAICCPWLQV